MSVWPTARTEQILWAEMFVSPHVYTRVQSKAGRNCRNTCFSCKYLPELQPPPSFYIYPRGSYSCCSPDGWAALPYVTVTDAEQWCGLVGVSPVVHQSGRHDANIPPVTSSSNADCLSSLPQRRRSSTSSTCSTAPSRSSAPGTPAKP